MLAVRKLAGVAPAMLARAILPMLRRYVGSALPALVIALLLALVTGTSWAQTRTPDAPDIPAVPGTNTEMPTPDKPGLALDLSDAATGVNISAPSTMAPGSTAYVTVTIRNSGTTTWYPGLPNPYRLGSQNPQDNRTWGVGRVELGSTVAPGGNAVFGFTITAPSTPGTYDFGWGMLREGLYWFGGNIASSIKVAAPAPVYDAQLISASVPSSMTAGGYYKVSITLKNTGNTTWTSPDFSLANSDDSQTFGISRVSMNPSTVAPGQSSTFDFQVRAPAAAGTYTFQWGMVWEYHQRFGQNSTTYITVSVPTTPKPTISPSHTAMVAGQAFTMSWSTTNATSVSHICSAAGTGYNVNEALAPSGSRSMTAQAGWVNYPSTCTWTANGPGGTTTVSETLTTTAVPTSKPTISVSRPSLVAGQSFTTSWSTTNATALTHVCTASGTGYKVNESLAVNGSRTLTAQSAWVGYPSSCTWTASGAGGSATYTETMTTVAGTNSSVTYIHTDGLGSPVARSDASGRLISRTRYEPYGYVASGVTPTIGFTGHVNDADTGLTYMQQRYYDPVAGRFLSIDPVVTDANTGSSFNRYNYANNSPYMYIDPDGRLGVAGFLVGAGIDLGVQVLGNMANGQSFGDSLSNVSVGQVLVSGALGAVGQIGGSAAARSIVSGMSNGAKGTLGEVAARVGIAARGEKVIASQTAAGKVAELGDITGRAAKAVPDFVTKAADGKVKVVEAKFGTAGLTGAQQALKSQMGEAFTVSRTTANEVANVAGHAGAVAGGSTGAAIGQQIRD